MDPSPYFTVDAQVIGQLACHLLKLAGAVVIFIAIVLFFRSIGEVGPGPDVKKRPRLPRKRTGGPVNARQQPVSRVPPLGGGPGKP